MVGSGCELFVLYKLTSSIEKQQISENVQTLLQEFMTIFDDPRSLPPARDYDHSIPINQGTAPVNVRPYRYAHFQKNEIERQVSDMLTK